MRDTGESIPKYVPYKKEAFVKSKKDFVPPCGINCRSKEKRSYRRFIHLVNSVNPFN
jgi:hypothetical protein